MDAGHLEQMQRSLLSPPKEVVPLGHLVAELEYLSEALNAVGDSWKHRFGYQWAALEQTYAVALDRKLQALDEEGVGLVAGAVGELRKLVEEALRTASLDAS